MYPSRSLLSVFHPVPNKCPCTQGTIFTIMEYYHFLCLLTNAPMLM